MKWRFLRLKKTNDNDFGVKLEIYKTAFEKANDIILLMDSNGKIIEANNQAITVYGYSKEELMNMNIFQIRYYKQDEFVENQFEIAKIEGIQFTTFHCKKDGSKFPVEVNSVGINTGSGKMLISIIRDITHRLQSEAEFRNLAAIVESSEDAILSEDLNGIITAWNKGAEKLYGYSIEEIVGKHVSTIIPKENVRDVDLILRRVINGIGMEKYETLRVGKDGKIINVSLGISPIYNMDKKIIGTSIIARDITEKMQQEKALKEKYEELSTVYEELTAAEEELRQNFIELEKAKDEADRANLAKNQFLDSVSHEIRTPMNGIIGIIDLLSITELNENQRQYVKILKNSSRLLLDVINSVLDISKIEAGKYELNMRPFNLKKFLEKVTAELSAMCTSKDLKPIYMLDPLIDEYLLGDEVKLHQILLNIINNAIKFTERGAITLSAKKIAQLNDRLTLEFSIADTGIGIKEEFKKDIFNKFTQQDMSYDKKYLGSGLGLAISKELVKLMNGNIWFESKEQHGSTFYFTADFLLDYYKGSDERIYDKEISIDLSIGENKKILIIENNEISLRIICDMIKEIGCEFICAYSGKQALNVLENQDVDLILMDIQMPELDGFEITKIIRHKEKNKKKHTPIVAMTAYFLLTNKEMCVEAGMDDYITKPFEMDTLINILQRYLF